MTTSDSAKTGSTTVRYSALRTIMLYIAFASVVSGCASSGIVSDIQTSTVPRQLANDGTYRLTAEDKALPCSKINGRIQLRILHLRHLEHGEKPSQISQSMRQTTNSIGVWSAPDSSAPQTRARDLALLEAYNRRLAELNCPTFDIKADLANRDINHIPSPKR